MQKIKQILIEHWGYSEFRPKQEAIIQSVIDGKDTLALLPTGGGKSLCYQVPALYLGGITLVVTPLIALMKDQVENLKQRNIPAVALYSGMRKNEYEVAINQCTHGNSHFLYLSPERLVSEDFLSLLPQLNIKLIAVDEAHCISQWGYDFRPPYLKIADIRPFFPNIPILALTATATPEVALDIQEKLHFKDSLFIKTSFARKNLVYFVAKEENKMETLLKIAKKQNGTGIIYVRNRKKTQEVANFLVKQNISASFYHAGLDSRVRDERQKKWKEGYLRIIVATNAFGMGIDKDNVRFVVHLDLPNNPEAYFQEAGRGGRDGKKAFSIILWEDADINNLYKYFKLSYPPIETIKQTYTALGNYFQIATGAGAGQNFTFNIIHFAKQYDKNPIVIYNSLKFLENQGLIIMSDAMHRPSKIRIDMNGNDLYRFQVSHPSFDNLIKYFLRNHPGLYQNFVAINETHLLKTFNITQEQLRSSLKKLVHLEVLSYEAESNTPMITFAIPRLATKDFYISKEVYDRRKTTALTRLKAIISYVETENKCRSQLLLSYFGEKDSKRCGQCDVCLERNKTQLSELEFDDIVKHIKPLLKNKPLAIDELVFETSYGDANRLLQAIQWLQDNGKITEDKDHILHWAE